MKRLTAVWRNIQNRKKWWIIAGVIALLASTYVFISVRYWQEYESIAAHHYQQTEEQMVKALKQTNANQDDKSKKLAAFEDVHRSINTLKDSCAIHAVFAWQQHLPVVKMKIDECQSKLKRLNQFNVLLGKIIVYLKDEHTLSVTITDAAKAVEVVSDADMPKLHQQWVSALQKIEKQSVSANFSDVKTTALQKVKVVMDTWQAVIDASAAKDRLKYEQNVASLAGTYEALHLIGQASERNLSTLQKEFGHLFSETFPET